MIATDEYRVSEATPGVEVVTAPSFDGLYICTINGGRLDGERFVGVDPERLHDAAVRLAKSAQRR